MLIQSIETWNTQYFFFHIFLKTATLEVVIPPDIVSEETSGDLMVPEGGSAKLICKARGYPKPKIVWRREDGREIISRTGPHGKTKCIYERHNLICFFNEFL